MTEALFVACVVSIVSFIFYGTSCIFSKKMILEFERYKLSRFRKLTGVLQILGSIGLFGGFFYGELAVISSFGLTALMFLGAIVRIRIKDSFWQTAPALFFFVLNLFIFWRSLREL
jgi:hypothetical protein